MDRVTRGSINVVRDWRDTLKEGDILTNGKTFRIVRQVYFRTYKVQGKPPLLLGVVLTIMRCSWTHRAYTHVGRSDLTWRKYTRVPGVRAKMTTPLDAKVNKCIRNNDRSLDCCDVHGVP